MLLITLLNGLLSAIFGFRFKIAILAPLITIALIEVMLLKQTRVLSSAFLSAIGLIISIEMGYLIGSLAGALRTSSGRESWLRDLTRHSHGRLPLH